MPVSVLALDLGNSTGWALRHINGRVDFGVKDLSPRLDEGFGRRFLAFANFLDDLQCGRPLLGDGSGLVVYEQAPGQRGHAARVYAGFEAVLTAWCEQKRIPYTSLHAMTLKKFFTGHGDADKAEMIVEARVRGYEVSSHDEADAVALIEWAVSHEEAA